MGETIRLPDGRVIVGKKPDVYASLAVINGAACYNAVLGFTPKGYTITTPAKPGTSIPGTVPTTQIDVTEADIFTVVNSQEYYSLGAAVLVAPPAPPVVPPSSTNGGITTTPGASV